MEYRIVTGKTHTSIELEVNGLLMQGWIPEGGICTASGAYGSVFFQSMVRGDLHTLSKHKWFEEETDVVS